VTADAAVVRAMPTTRAGKQLLCFRRRARLP